MAYDEQLLQRIRQTLLNRKDVTEKKMFGGVAFMVKRNMACGPHGANLIVRIGNEAAAKAMREPHVKPMNFTGKVLKSFAVIGPAGMKDDSQLRHWVEMAAAYAASLPPAKSKRPAKKVPRKAKK